MNIFVYIVSKEEYELIRSGRQKKINVRQNVKENDKILIHCILEEIPGIQCNIEKIKKEIKNLDDVIISKLIEIKIEKLCSIDKKL